jgi:hypothetical protein
VITGNNATRPKNGVYDYKTWKSDAWKHEIWSDALAFTLFPTSGLVYVWRKPKEAYNACFQL